MSNHSIIEDLLEGLPKDPVPVRSVLVGAHWTSVRSTYCGLATTVIGGKPHDISTVVRDAGYLHQKSAQELAVYVRSENPLDSSIGMVASTRSPM